MNLTIITGNVTQIYENSASHIKIIVADNYKEKTTYIPIMCFEKQATWAIRNLRAGDHIMVKAHVGTYTGNDGTTKISIIAETISYEGYPSSTRRAEREAVQNKKLFWEDEENEKETKGENKNELYTVANA